MPELVRLYIRQCLIGFALSGVFVALLLGFDVAGLRRLVIATEGGFLAVFLLFFFNGLVFAGVQFGMTIMRMARPEDDGRGGRRDAIPSDAAVVKLKVAGPQRP
jgi:hypothetical protein